jgi:hypothetical protein
MGYRISLLHNNACKTSSNTKLWHWHSKLLSPLLKCMPRLFPNPPSSLVTNITRILEVNTAKDPAISIIPYSLINAGDPFRDDLLNAHQVTAGLHIDLVAAVSRADDSASSSENISAFASQHLKSPTELRPVTHPHHARYKQCMTANEVKIPEDPGYRHSSSISILTRSCKR